MSLKDLFKQKPPHGYEAHPTILGKIWHFLAHEDSLASLIADLLIVLFLSKYIIYPLIGLALGTSFPFVVVVSSSMDHYNKDFDNWWEANKAWYLERNITKEQFQAFPFKDGFKKGDVFVVRGIKNISVGDVIIYTIPSQKDPIIHRVVNKSEDYYETKGDANQGQFGFEKVVLPSQIKGKAVIKIPYLGWIKVGLFEIVSKIKSKIFK
ncbi:MAG: hypothetical protein ACP5JY_00365 [Candidatus Nanoarchaeia archaeon]